MYFAIIGDIVNSKKLTNRWIIQKELKEVLDLVNTDYKEYLVSMFSITLGDEFQGLFKNADKLLQVMDIIRCKMHPVELRFGIGIGNMNTKIIHDTSMGSDGPAYWAAREAINYIHDNNDYGYSQMYISFYQNDRSENNYHNQLIEILNSTLCLCDRIKNSWTSSQYNFVREVFLEYRYGNNGEYCQTEIADALGVSRQMVNSKMKNTGLTSYVKAKRSVEKMLQKQWGN